MSGRYFVINEDDLNELKRGYDTDLRDWSRVSGVLGPDHGLFLRIHRLPEVEAVNAIGANFPTAWSFTGPAFPAPEGGEG